jgi:hypothetical protein
MTVQLMAGQAQDCAGGMPRRDEAIALARSINAAEVRAQRAAQTYQPLASLSGIFVPTGLSAQLVTGETGYLFVVRNTSESCGFAVFSDQTRAIYLGRTLQ